MFLNRRFAVLWLLACLPLARCSLFRPRIVPYPTGLVFPLALDSTLYYQGKIITPARQENGRIFFATQAGFVHCLDGLKRQALWSFRADNPIEFPVCLGPNGLFALDRKNCLYCLDVDGVLSWKKTLDVSVSTPLVASEDVLFCGLGGSEIAALSISGQGATAWKYDPGAEVTTAPALGEGRVYFGADNGRIHTLDFRGKLLAVFDVQEKISAPPLVSGGRLYFGTEGRYYNCLDAKTGKRKWRAKLGGTVTAAPVVHGRRLLVPASNSVLYCLNKKSGSVLWWRIIPSRYSYDPIIVEKRVAVTSLAPVLRALDLASGADSGEFSSGHDFQANALWLDPYVVLHQYDFATDTGLCFFLKKDVQVGLNTDKASPQPAGEEITCSASAVGFYRPRFEFYIKAGDARTVLQKESDKQSCVWFPDKEGTYLLGARVVDAKQTRETEIPFVVEKKPEK